MRYIPRVLALSVLIAFLVISHGSLMRATERLACQDYNPGDDNCPTFYVTDFFTVDSCGGTDDLMNCDAACDDYFTPGGQDYCGGGNDSTCRAWCGHWGWTLYCHGDCTA